MGSPRRWPSSVHWVRNKRRDPFIDTRIFVLPEVIDSTFEITGIDGATAHVTQSDSALNG